MNYSSSKNMENFLSLLYKSESISEKVKNQQKITGANFNIFSILHVASDEVRICRVINELIDTNGCHCQGDIFLRLFIKHVLHIGDEFSDKEFKSAQIEREKHIKNDRRNEIEKAELTEKCAKEFSCSAGETICYTNLMSHCSIDKNTAPEYPRHVIEKLKPVSSIGDRCYEHILWYNPFVFDVSGNACTNKKLQEIQFPLCQKLLFQSVDIFVPTHILFMAGTKKVQWTFLISLPKKVSLKK